MNRYHSYLNTAVKLIGLYKKGEPLHLHLKKHFAANKKMGSRDRKVVADLCYSYFRLKLMLPAGVEIQQQILIAAFVCGKDAAVVANSIHPEWMLIKELSLSEKLKHFQVSGPESLPFYNQLSSSIQQEAFCQSLLLQPNVFVRVRPGYMTAITARLQERGFHFQKISEQMLSVAQGSKLDGHLRLNKEAVIQDESSSLVFDSVIAEINKRAKVGDGVLHVWDVCAASGGKSILFHDLYLGSMKLTVSDIRENMLGNLSQRLAEAGINLYRKFSADVTAKVPLGSDEKFDVVICDVPCSGSGTWARTPEQYAFYDDADWARYTEQQRKITLNAARFLKDDGWLVYITCSAFASENEKNVKLICKNGQLVCMQENYLTGYAKAADTLYCAVLKKSINLL